MVGERDKLNALFHIFCVPTTADTFSVEVLALWPAHSCCLSVDMSLLMLYPFCLSTFTTYSATKNTCRLPTFVRRKSQLHIENI